MVKAYQEVILQEVQKHVGSIKSRDILTAHVVGC